MAQWKFVEWLLFWLLETKECNFEWDSGNTSKSQEKHNVTISEAESAFQIGKALPLGVEINSLKRDEERLGLIGKSFNNKILFIVFVIRKKKIRIISARLTNKKERNKYEEDLRKILKSL